MNRQPQHPCPTCHGFARVPVADRQFACARCGTVLPPLPYVGRGRGNLSHLSPVRIGMKARIGGKEFHCVGRIRYVQAEDDETYYWEEWVLLNPDGDARYLEFDEGKWTLSEPFQPAPGAPSAGEFSIAAEGVRYTVDGLSVTVTDAGACQVKTVEGEIPWPVAPGDRLRYVDMEGGGGFFSAEIGGDDGAVEWFRGRRLDDRAVYTLFDLRELIADLDRRAAAARSRRSFGLLCLAVALAALIGWGVARGRGRVVAQGSAAIANVPQEGTRFGPYRLTAAGRVHRLRVSSNLSQSAAWVQAVIETEDAGELFDTAGELWDETGYDDEGRWHEYRLQSQSDFRLAREGDVYVRVYAEPDTAAAAAGTVSFAIEEGVLYPTYLGSFGALSLVLGCVFFLTGAAGATQQTWQGMGSRGGAAGS